jgi:hypothetical protein
MNKCGETHGIPIFTPKIDQNTLYLTGKIPIFYDQKGLDSL